jgi:hypothetical protein
MNLYVGKGFSLNIYIYIYIYINTYLQILRDQPLKKWNQWIKINLPSVLKKIF